MLSAEEQQRADWGAGFKRVIRAAAAMNEYYDDKAIALAARVSRNTVSSWWDGAKPTPETVKRLAAPTGWKVSELLAWIHGDADPPPLIYPDSALYRAVQTGRLLDPDDQPSGGPSVPELPPVRPSIRTPREQR